MRGVWDYLGRFGEGFGNLFSRLLFEILTCLLLFFVAIGWFRQLFAGCCWHFPAFANCFLLVAAFVVRVVFDCLC